MLTLFFNLLVLGDCLNFEYIPETGQPPGRRLYLTMQYEPERNELLVCCGQETNTLIYNDLWDFNLDTETWTAHPNTASVHPRKF